MERSKSIFFPHPQLNTVMTGWGNIVENPMQETCTCTGVFNLIALPCLKQQCQGSVSAVFSLQISLVFQEALTHSTVTKCIKLRLDLQAVLLGLGKADSFSTEMLKQISFKRKAVSSDLVSFTCSLYKQFLLYAYINTRTYQGVCLGMFPLKCFYFKYIISTLKLKSQL